VKTIGIGESWLSDKIKSWEEQLPAHIKLAYLPGLGEVRLRLTAIGESQIDLERDVGQQVELVRPLISKYIYGYDQDSIPKVVGELLRKHRLTLAVAESCTGGGVSKDITSIEGSSQYFVGSLVAYQNRLKQSMLGVSEEILRNHGAVSEPTIIAMASGVRKYLNADIGIATSGIAGPGGGTEEKPVGTVWIACSDGNNTMTKKLSLYKDRNINIQYSTKAVLNLLRQRLVEMDGEKT
jgi:nicotinamide-nucleotide amidase